MMSNPIVTITMENGDVMKAELYPEIAPNTVNNFISLVKKGFYLDRFLSICNYIDEHCSPDPWSSKCHVSAESYRFQCKR